MVDFFFSRVVAGEVNTVVETLQEYGEGRPVNVSGPIAGAVDESQLRCYTTTPENDSEWRLARMEPL